jgi:hypothetical protein
MRPPSHQLLTQQLGLPPRQPSAMKNERVWKKVTKLIGPRKLLPPVARRNGLLFITSRPLFSTLLCLLALDEVVDLLVVAETVAEVVLILRIATRQPTPRRRRLRPVSHLSRMPTYQSEHEMNPTPPEPILCPPKVGNPPTQKPMRNQSRSVLKIPWIAHV